MENTPFFSPGSSSANVAPGTADGQLFRWDDTNQRMEPVAGATMDADGNITTGGSVTAGSAATPGQLSLTDGTDTHIVKAVQETGLGGRLTIGLDETARTLVVCGAGDVDTDFGLLVRAAPTFLIFSESGTASGILDYYRLRLNNSQLLIRHSGYTADFQIEADVAGDNAFELSSGSNIELTDTDGEQSWLYVEPKVNQSATAGYNAFKIDVTETATGDGSAGQGNNLIWAGVGGTRKFEVDNTGVGYFAGALTAASYADNTPGYTGDALADLAKIKTVAGEIDHDTLPAFALTHRTNRIKTVGPRVEVDAAEALEIYDEDVPAYDMVDKRQMDGTVKQVKRLRVIGQKTTGYELADDGTVTEKTEPVYETRKVQKKRVREGYEFDAATGKFFRKGDVTVVVEEVPGRDLGAMISILTVAVQQLTDRIEALEAAKIEAVK